MNESAVLLCSCFQRRSEAQFLVPDLGDKVDYDIGLSTLATEVSRIKINVGEGKVGEGGCGDGGLLFFNICKKRRGVMTNTKYRYLIRLLSECLQDF